MKNHDKYILLALLCCGALTTATTHAQNSPSQGTKPPSAKPTQAAALPAADAPPNEITVVNIDLDEPAESAPNTSKGEASNTPAKPEETGDASRSTETTGPRQITEVSPVEALARAGKPWIGHRPVNTERSGSLSLSFDVRGGDLIKRISVYHRPVNLPAQAPTRTDAAVFEGGYIAELPEEATAAPGLVYWVEAELSDGTTQAVFASASSPHPVALNDTAQQAETKRLLGYFEGRRSVLGVRGEYVDLAAPTGASERDGYGALSAFYRHRFLGVLDELEVGLGLLRGSVVDLDGSDSTETGEPEAPGGTGAITSASPDDETGNRDARRLGINQGYGRATLRLKEWLRFRGTLLLSVDTVGFTPGLDAAIILGYRQSTELMVYGGTIQSHGGFAGLRLGWNSIPNFPMGATVEATNFPDAAEAGVRLLYDIAYELSPGRQIKVEAGYRGRTAIDGGVSLGTEFIWSL